MRGFTRQLTFLCISLILISCSSNNGLRKFDESGLDTAVPEDTAKKFEVKEVGSETPTPSPTPEPKITKHQKRKKKVSKAESAMIEASSTPAPVVPPLRRVDPLRR